MCESTFRLWQIITTFLSSMLVLAGILMTIIHFNKTQATQLKVVEKQINSQREENKENNLNGFQNSFWTKQLELYLQASSYAAKLTQYPFNTNAYNDARIGFYTLFHGPMSIVEDEFVKDAMEEYSTQLFKFEKTKLEEDLKNLKNKSYCLALTCRQSSIKRWDLKEFELEDKTPPKSNT